MVLELFNCLAGDMRPIGIIVPEFEFGDVERQIFGGDLMECIDDALA